MGGAGRGRGGAGEEPKGNGRRQLGKPAGQRFHGFHEGFVC